MTVEKRRIRVSGGEIAYVEAGDGPPALLLHGFPTSSHLWRDLVPILAPRFHVIAPDLLGYGDSGKPGDEEALTIRAQAAHLRELLDRLGLERPAVVAHDIGGGVAQLLALDGIAATLVLVDTIAFDSWPIDAVRMIQQIAAENADTELARGVVGFALEAGMARIERLADADRDEYVRPWLADPAAIIHAARGIDGVGLTEIEDRLRDLDLRVLVLWGEEDPFLPATDAERLGDLLQGASVALLPGCSHFVTEDAPEATLPLIAEYLRTHQLGERGHAHAGPVPVDLGVSFERPAGPSPPEGFEDLG